MHPIEAAARWYAIVATATWAVAPLVRWLCIALADRGVSIARPIGLLVAIYPTWWLAAIGVAEFGATPVALSVLLIAALGWGLLVRTGRLEPDWLSRLALAELASAALFALYLWLRGYTPQILGTEKPMDLAFLASSARAVAIPPPDPWFAGEPINYYYLGYLLHGSVARFSGVAPEIGFNLALATVFSMTAVAAFGVAWNVVRPRFGAVAGTMSGLLAAFSLVLAGNLYAPLRLAQDAGATIAAWWWDKAAGIGWRASRIVCDGERVANDCPPPATETINEFPFFSFLLGDLHPHLMALPYTLVATALAWNLALLGTAAMTRWAPGARIALTGAIVGSLYPLNAWDFPTFTLLAAVGIWISSGVNVNRAWKPIAMLAVVSIVAWLPFLATYVPPTLAASGRESLSNVPIVSSVLSTVAIHLGERTSAAEYLTVFGVPYVVGLVFVVSCVMSQDDEARQATTRTAAIAFIASTIPAVVLSAPVLVLCGVPLAIAVDQLRHSHAIGPRSFALGLFSVAWVLSIAVELFYIRDAFDDRMNTLFKLYYQTWTLYALASAVSIATLWSAAPRARLTRLPLALATVAAIVLTSTYPVIASYQWTEGFGAWRGLDGIAYARETDPNDLVAIRWLSEQASPGDVVLEAAGCAYRPGNRLPFNRVAMITGIPTIVGWGDNHQRQWRAGQPALIDEIPRRTADVAAMYADPGSNLLDRYSVDWIFVGEYEAGSWRDECGTAGRYEGLDTAGYPGPEWEEAFASGNTRIYRRRGG